jgi:hypothetical protein
MFRRRAVRVTISTVQSVGERLIVMTVALAKIGKSQTRTMVVGYLPASIMTQPLVQRRVPLCGSSAWDRG